MGQRIVGNDDFDGSLENIKYIDTM
jgi:hypothetical protein